MIQKNKKFLKELATINFNLVSFSTIIANSQLIKYVLDADKILRLNVCQFEVGDDKIEVLAENYNRFMVHLFLMNVKLGRIMSARCKLETSGIKLKQREESLGSNISVVELTSIFKLQVQEKKGTYIKININI